MKMSDVFEDGLPVEVTPLTECGTLTSIHFMDEEAEAAAHAINMHDELVDTVRRLAQTLAWQSHGERRGFSDGLDDVNIILEKARSVLGEEDGGA